MNQGSLTQGSLGLPKLSRNRPSMPEKRPVNARAAW